MRDPRHFLTVLLVPLLPCTLLAAPGDADNDGLRDAAESNTGIYVSPENTGTNPNVADSDGDSLPDGMEINLGTNPSNAASKVKRPNIIYILADDLGYGDIGCFWQNQRTSSMKFATPALDTMASQGAMLTNHYVSGSICAAARCSFLQGRNQGHSEVRDYQFDKPISATYSLAGTLKAAGYRNIHIGKAGLAGYDSRNPTAHPLTRGFDRFFGYLTHTEAHEHYPRNGTTTKAAMICDDYRFINDAYQDLFTGDVFTAFAKKEIIEQTSQRPNQPFFIYLSLDLPHFLGQYAPTATYPSGLGVNGGVQWIPGGVDPVTGLRPYVNTAVNDPNRVNKEANRHPSIPSAWGADSKTFVSMVRRMDESVADILQTLRDLGIDQDTLVIFTSDNGPEPNGVYPPNFDSYGPFEGVKGDLFEGGIRVPTIAWWPGKISGTNDLSNIRKITRPCVNYDWLATFSDMAKAPIPSFTDGTSLIPTLTGTGTQIDKGFLFFELNYFGTIPAYPLFVNHGNETRNYMQAIRIGDFKGVRYNITTPDAPFRVYNVVSDPKESVNLAASRPDLVQEMQRLSVGARRPIQSTSRPYDTSPIPPKQLTSPVRNGLRWKSYQGYWPWLPELRTLTPVSSGECADITTSVRPRDNDFGLFFEGYVNITTAGAYTFQINSNSGAALWVHETYVLDNDTAYAASKNSSTVYLKTGLHPIRLYYRSQGGTPSLQLRYSGPGIPVMTNIPQSVFFQDGQPTVLQADIAVTTAQTPVTISVLANDTSQNPLELRTVSTPSHGSAAINDGSVVYTPTSGFIGFDLLSYTVYDGVREVTAPIDVQVLFDNEIWIPLDEGAGTSVNTYGSSTVTGILSGTGDPAQTWTSGKLGTALKFDGVDDQVVFPALPLPAGGAPRSFSCWLRTTNTSLDENQTIFTYGSASGGQRFTVRLSNGTSAGSLVAAVEAFPGSVTGTKALNDGRWHHLALVLTDLDNNGFTNIAETRLYVDGQPEAVYSIVSGLLDTAVGTSACLGGSDQSTACNFNGSLDDVRIFPRALSGSEIQELYQDTLATGVMYGMPPNDSDNDGIPDQAEIVAGTNPDDPSSFFKIGSHNVSSDGAITLQWVGMAGRSYRVEESTNLKDWTLVPGVAPVVVTSNTPNASLTVPANGAAKRFVRLQVMLTP